MVCNAHAVHVSAVADLAAHVVSAQIGSKCSGTGKLQLKGCRTAAASGCTIWALHPPSEAICVVHASVSRGVSTFFMLSSTFHCSRLHGDLLRLAASVVAGCARCCLVCRCCLRSGGPTALCCAVVVCVSCICVALVWCGSLHVSRCRLRRLWPVWR